MLSHGMAPRRFVASPAHFLRGGGARRHVGRDLGGGLTLVGAVARPGRKLKSQEKNTHFMETVETAEALIPGSHPLQCGNGGGVPGILFMAADFA